MQISRSPNGGIEFARFTPSGAVHILRNELHTIDHTLGSKTVSAAAWLMGRQWALCGRKAPTPGSQYGITEFADDALCRGCYKAASELLDSTDELFEHDVPEAQSLADEQAQASPDV